MRSYAASETQVLTKLRIPASIPYVFTALKISATASVIGAIIGELPAGLGDGLGRSLLTFSYYYVSGPEKLYGAILISALLGITFVALVSLAERIVVNRATPMTRKMWVVRRGRSGRSWGEVSSAAPLSVISRNRTED
jgi:NitT/TauT family transport system permease protein